MGVDVSLYEPPRGLSKVDCAYLLLEGLDGDDLAGPPDDTLPQAAAGARRDYFDELKGFAIAAGRRCLGLGTSLRGTDGIIVCTSFRRRVRNSDMCCI